MDFEKLTGQAVNSVRNAGKYEIEVVAGAHQGASVTVDSGEFTVGASKDNHMVLFADDISEKHLMIELPSNVLKDIRVVPEQQSIYLDDGSIVEVGQQARIHSGEVIGLGNAEIAITRIADPRSALKPGIRIFAIACLIAMIPLLFSLFSGFAVGVADASSKAFSAIQTGINSQTERYLGTPATSEKGQAEAFSWTARTKLEDLKLNHRLRVSSTEAGSLRVYGNISDQELARWTAFLQWYDSNPGFPPLIRDVNRSDVDRDVPQINSVWMDSEPTVVFKDGTVAAVGAQLKDGWKVVTISADSVMLERDGAFVSLTF